MKILKLFTIVALSGILLTACQPPAKDGETKEETGEAQVAEKKNPVVRVKSLKKEIISRTVDYNSTLKANEEVYIAPAQPGRIQKIFVEPGDRVKKGQKLFAMDETQLHQTKIQVKSMEVDIKRMETLLETGSITQQAYDQLKTQYDVTNASLQFLEKNTVMYAPFSGVITNKYFENGEMFGGAPNTQAGKASIVTLMQTNPLKAVLMVSEGYYPLMNKGMEASLEVDVFDDDEFNGEITLIYPTIDPLTRSFQVEIEVPNNSNKLKPGMFTRVSMLIGESETFVVSSNTVLQQEGTNVRYLFVNENGIAKRYNVIIGQRFDDKIEIISNEISEGDIIIVEGHTKLMDGDKIKVVE